MGCRPVSTAKRLALRGADIRQGLVPSSGFGAARLIVRSRGRGQSPALHGSSLPRGPAKASTPGTLLPYLPEAGEGPRLRGRLASRTQALEQRLDLLDNLPLVVPEGCEICLQSGANEP